MWMCQIAFLGMLLGLAMSAPVVTTTSVSAVLKVEQTISTYDAGLLLVVSEEVLIDSETSQPAVPCLGQIAGLVAAKSEGAFANYMRQAQTLDVATAENGAVFYSGQGNRALAEQFAAANGRTTMEMTSGGRWLDQQQLFGPNSPLTRDQAVQVWSTLSQRFAAGASGNAVGFVNGARAGSIFNTVEYPALLNNRNVVNVITGGH